MQSVWSLKVDKHIRRLDSDLARFETEIKEKSSVATLSAEEDTPPTAKSTNMSKTFIMNFLFIFSSSLPISLFIPPIRR